MLVITAAKRLFLLVVFFRGPAFGKGRISSNMADSSGTGDSGGKDEGGGDGVVGVDEGDGIHERDELDKGGGVHGITLLSRG